MPELRLPNADRSVSAYRLSGTPVPLEKRNAKTFPRIAYAAAGQIMRQAPGYLQVGGLFLMEIGAWQGASAYQMAQSVFPQARVNVHQDLAGLDRIVAIET